MTRTLEVLAVGASALVQDAGRPGKAHLGVPRSGWLDAGAARLANRLVGNQADAAVVECLLGGLRVRAGAAMTVAVTGAVVPVHVGWRPVAFGEPVSLSARDVLGLGVPPSGLRSYVAVAGGIDVRPALGSRSTDTLSGTGPPRLDAGTVLPVGPAAGEPRPADVPVRRRSQTRGSSTLGRGSVTELRLHAGPRVDWFSGPALATLTGATYTVDADSDRIGLRLDGPALARVVGDELPSEGIVLGAVQVPAEGRPLVFLRDHPTTGGYPVVAVVEEADLDACAQLRPGDEVSFRWVRPAAASGGAG